MEELGTIGVGCVVGLLVIGIVNAFPGEPFDYDKGQVPLEASPITSHEALTAASSDSNIACAREVDIAASQLKVQKLQELLGLEKNDVQRMIAKAKDDAINGRQPTTSVNYARWLDVVFYIVILAMMVVVLRAEYSVDVFQLLASFFPREAETIRKVTAILPSSVAGWWRS